MTDPETCPHCGSDDYSTFLEDNPVRVCLTCGYDSVHGDVDVCPGGKHPKDARNDLCCDPCWDRLPAKIPDLDGTLRPWRRRRKQSRQRHRRWADAEWFEHNNKTIREWLAANPQEQNRA